MNQTNEPVAWLFVGANVNKGMSMVRLNKPKKLEPSWWEVKPLAIIEPNTVTIPSEEYAKLKEDAARYKWLRLNCSYIIGYGLKWECIPHQDDKPPFDYLIDQARSEE